MAVSQPVLSALGIKRETHFTVYVLPGSNGVGFTGPDKAHHDTMVPSSFVLRKGTRVTFTVVNLDDMKHSITAPGLGVNIIIKAGVERKNGTIAPSTTTYTFIPAKAGEFRWYCVFPCDMPQHWAMSASYDGPDRDGFMAGSHPGAVTADIRRSACEGTRLRVWCAPACEDTSLIGDRHGSSAIGECRAAARHPVARAYGAHRDLEEPRARVAAASGG